MALDTRQTCWTPSGRSESWQCRKINHPGRGLIKVPSVQHLFKRPLSRPLMQYRSELSAVGFEPKAIIRLRPSELDRQNGPSFSQQKLLLHLSLPHRHFASSACFLVYLRKCIGCFGTVLRQCRRLNSRRYQTGQRCSLRPLRLRNRCNWCRRRLALPSPINRPKMPILIVPNVLSPDRLLPLWQDQNLVQRKPQQFVGRDQRPLL